MALYPTLAKAEKPLHAVLDVMKASGDPALSAKDGKILAVLAEFTKRVDATVVAIAKYEKAAKALPLLVEKASDKAEGFSDTMIDLVDPLRKLAKDMKKGGRVDLGATCKGLAASHKQSVVAFKSYAKRLKSAIVAAEQARKQGDQLLHMKTAINRWNAGLRMHVDMLLKDLDDWKPKHLNMDQLKELQRNAKQAKQYLASLKKRAR